MWHFQSYLSLGFERGGGSLGTLNVEVDCKRLVSDIKPIKSSVSGETTERVDELFSDKCAG